MKTAALFVALLLSACAPTVEVEDDDTIDPDTYCRTDQNCERFGDSRCDLDAKRCVIDT